MYSRLSIKIIRQGAIEFMVKLAKMLKVALRGPSSEVWIIVKLTKINFKHFKITLSNT